MSGWMGRGGENFRQGLNNQIKIRGAHPVSHARPRNKWEEAEVRHAPQHIAL